MRGTNGSWVAVGVVSDGLPGEVVPGPGDRVEVCDDVAFVGVPPWDSEVSRDPDAEQPTVKTPTATHPQAGRHHLLPGRLLTGYIAYRNLSTTLQPSSDPRTPRHCPMRGRRHLTDPCVSGTSA
ncbi:MAG: hypothetical protein H0U36_09485 [Nocardioidaceae bacterium]|nr:hypothetical protein [Nocardioidaceae bacterium]